MLRYYKPADIGTRGFKLIDDFQTIVADGTYTNGERARALSEKVASRTGYAHAISFGSGTQAIFLLARWYWKLGFRRILAPAFTWPSTYLPFQWLGYTIQFVDIDRETWLADFGDARPNANELFIPVDTFGSSWAPSSDGLPKCPFVDSAQSLGAKWSDTTPTRIVSLSGSKILTSGEGGILLTQDQELADFATNQNWFSRMPELSAALGLAYLEHFDEILEKKRRIADAYHTRFPNIGWQKCETTNHYIVAALVDSPREWAKANSEVEMRFYYQSAVSETDEKIPIESIPQLPNTEFVSRRLICFPAWPDLPLDAIDKIVEP